MILDIVTIGDERLKQKSQPVERVDGPVSTLIENMIETMYAHNGIGLAAVQVGVLKRIFVIDIPQVTQGAMVFVNPEIVKVSRDCMTYKEGCLSVPNLSYDITRPRSLIVRYLDEGGGPRELEAKELLAICIQHETDHLNGILFIENVRDREHKKINKLLEKKRLPRFF